MVVDVVVVVVLVVAAGLAAVALAAVAAVVMPLPPPLLLQTTTTTSVRYLPLVCVNGTGGRRAPHFVRSLLCLPQLVDQMFKISEAKKMVGQHAGELDTIVEK